MSLQLKMAGVMVSSANASVRKPTLQVIHDGSPIAPAAIDATQIGAKITANKQERPRDLMLLRRGTPRNDKRTPKDATNTSIASASRNAPVDRMARPVIMS